MKKFTKLLGIVLIIALVMSMGTMAFADDPAPVPTAQVFDTGNAPDATGKYTISVASDDTHTYTVYQILTGSLVAGESKLGNAAWGSDAKGDGTVDAFIESITAAGLTNAEISARVSAQLKTEAAGVGTVSASKTLDVVPGYYLLVDTTAADDLEEGEGYSLNIVAVFNDITITPKKGTTTSVKHVDDQNDSDSTDHSELKDSADYDIGDTIPYTLTMTLPEDYANYKEYYVMFTDEMSKGLTYNGDANIYFGAGDTTGTKITFTVADSTATEAPYEGGKVYAYTIDNLKADAYTSYGLTGGSVIRIEYTATLNDAAVVGSAGNPNRYKVTFSNNPNHEGDGTPTNDTPWDINIVFTYKTIFNKVDKDNKPLTGADFTLYKKVVDNSEAGFSWVDVTTLHTGDGAKNPSKTKDNVTDGDKTVANAKFTFSGLDAGDYKLSETATPTGYNTIADIEFKITATHELESADPKLTSLTGTGGAEFTMTSSVPDGSLSADIKNLQGSTLPSTGGIGTTIFYVVGSILVVAAGVLLITKKRMGRE